MKTGDIIENEEGKRKVLGVAGEVVFLSAEYDHEVVACMYTKKTIQEEGYNLPKEKWEPTYNKKYYFIYAGGTVELATWYDYDEDKARLAFGNVFETQEEAEAARDKVKELLSL